MNPDTQDQAPPFAGFVGIDWGNKSNAFHLVASDGSNPSSGKFPNSPDALHEWGLELQRRWPNSHVAIAVESGCPSLLAFLARYPWVTVYVVHPTTSKRFRQALIPSGAKDDLPDAAILLDLVRHHRNWLRPYRQPDVAIACLEARCKSRRHRVEQRIGLVNELSSLLAKFYPVALELCGEALHAPLALDFLTRWPDPLSLRKAKASTLRSFFHRHNVRRSEVVEARIERAHTARFPEIDETLIQVAREEVQALVSFLQPLREAIERLEEAIERDFKAQPDAAFFSSLPGAGKNMAPRLMVLFGTSKERWSGADQLQKVCGVAPITERSGGSCWVHRRWHTRHFDHQTMVEWARCSVAQSGWARAYVKQQTQRGSRAFGAYRALAYKWLRILWACWKNGTEYDEERYVKRLRERGSALAQEKPAAERRGKARASSKNAPSPLDG